MKVRCAGGSFVSVALSVALAVATVGCGSASRSGDEQTTTLGPIGGSDSASSDSDGSGSSESGSGTPKLDVGDGDTAAGDEGGDNCAPSAENATLRGTVYAPNLEIPISGALVWVTDGEVEPVPDGTYCAECVGIPCDADFVLTEADGSFELPAKSGTHKLAVAKGQFLHVTEIDIVEGDNDIAPTDSNLPGRWAPNEGMWIPRIAVVSTFNDSIYNLLAKIGLGTDDGTGALASGSENFDLLDQASGGALLDDLTEMRKYHIIFIPCMSQVGMGGLNQLRIENIRQYVEEGGKWYVTDWANEYLYEPFPNYQTLNGQSFDPDLGYYDTDGTVTDPDLLAWLQALPAPLKDIGGGYPNLLSLPTVTLEDNWSGIDSIPPVIVQDDMGNDVDVGHHKWVEGPCPECDTSGVRPMTISAEYGCGRMMFSTYHTTEGAHSGLTPQELILLYIILEIGVCFDEPPPGPPPVG
jgi:hypothetical protein